jgi:cellulose biosynthesis protein BcsQ
MSDSRILILPAHIDLVAVEIELVGKDRRDIKWKRPYPILQDTYDHILIDCAFFWPFDLETPWPQLIPVIITIQCRHFTLEGSWELWILVKYTKSWSGLDIEGIIDHVRDSRLRYRTKSSRYVSIFLIWNWFRHDYTAQRSVERAPAMVKALIRRKVARVQPITLTWPMKYWPKQ